MSDTQTAILDPTEVALKDLLERGSKRRCLTWEELNETLPDEAISPDKLEMIMMTLEENGIEMIDEIEANRRGVSREQRMVEVGRKPKPAPGASAMARPEPAEEQVLHLAGVAPPGRPEEALGRLDSVPRVKHPAGRCRMGG